MDVTAVEKSCGKLNPGNWMNRWLVFGCRNQGNKITCHVFMIQNELGLHDSPKYIVLKILSPPTLEGLSE